jgi:hypothetical protein
VKKDVEKTGLISDIWYVVKRERKFWIIPLLVLLFSIVGLMLAAGTAGPLAPFIYPFL